jgi:ABC-type nitrate/sulfonate/bicarbonate transport system substrate-binding protein
VTVWLLVLLLCPVTTAAVEKFTCILGGTGTRHAIPVLAESFGLYLKYGLEPAIIRIGSGTIATAALVGGEADLINTAGPGLINARLQGAGVLHIANFNDWSDAHLLVRPEVNAWNSFAPVSLPCPASEEAMRTCYGRLCFPSTDSIKAPNNPRSYRLEILRPVWLGL